VGITFGGLVKWDGLWLGWPCEKGITV